MPCVSQAHPAHRLSWGAKRWPSPPWTSRMAGSGHRHSEPNVFTANPARGGTKIATGHRISENPGDSTVQNLPEPIPYFQPRGLEIPGGSLRTNGEAVGAGVLCGSNATSGLSRHFGKDESLFQETGPWSSEVALYRWATRVLGSGLSVAGGESPAQSCCREDCVAL